jgi:hypothetical protein
MASELAAGNSLRSGERLTSPNGRFTLYMQPDGNLVLYDGALTVTAAYWATQTWTLPPDLRPTRADMQHDGHLVLYNDAGTPAWGSGVWGSQYAGSRLVVQDDGDLVIYAANGTRIWATRTVRAARESFWEVTLNGVRCDTQTWDDALNRDGWADEIYFGIQTLITDKGGNLLTWPDTSRSRIHGQANGFVNRVPAGSRTSSGGFQSQDEFPTPNPSNRQGRTLSGDALPMQLWSGPLDENTLVAFTPTIWEWDGGQDVLTTLFDQLNTNGIAIAKAVADVFGTIDPARGAVVKPVVETISNAMPALTAFLGSFIGQAGDRPIGTKQDAQGKRTFTPKTFILNEAIGERLQANSFGDGPGIVEVEYLDSPNIGGGTYRMWLEARKLS